MDAPVSLSHAQLEPAAAGPAVPPAAFGPPGAAPQTPGPAATPPASPRPHVIEAENLGKYYRLYDRPADRLKSLLLSRFGRVYGRKFWAVRQVSLQVARGEAVGIVGRNGSGKSTLLQMIAGTLRPSTGTIRTAGRIAALLELGSGFNPEFTGRENVYLNASILGMSREETDRRLDDILAFADIGPFIDQPVKTYSSGMFVRLAFAVAVNVDPDVLIVDEALSVGDLTFQAKCFRKIRDFRDRGVSLLLVTHDLSALTRFCDRAVVLDRGRVRGSGSAKEMVDLYKQIVMPDGGNAPAPTPAAGTPPAAPPGTVHAATPTRLRDRHTIASTLLEYGDRDMEIVDFGLLDARGEPLAVAVGGERLTVVVTAEVRRPVKHPILAFTIKDLRGTEVCGTNTLFMEEDLGVRRPGERVTVRWSFDAHLQRGAYTLSLGCTELVEAGLAVHHRLYDVLTFESQPFQRFVGFYDLRPAVSVVRG